MMCLNVLKCIGDKGGYANRQYLKVNTFKYVFLLSFKVETKFFLLSALCQDMHCRQMPFYPEGDPTVLNSTNHIIQKSLLLAYNIKIFFLSFSLIHPSIQPLKFPRLFSTALLQVFFWCP